MLIFGGGVGLGVEIDEEPGIGIEVEVFISEVARDFLELELIVCCSNEEGG